MKLVQMPVELIHLDADDLPGLGVDAGLLAGFRRYLDAQRDTFESLAILAPPEAGTRELLMVLARRVGAVLRDENIRLRDRGGNLAADRQKFCYLPGAALPDAFRAPASRRTLEHEAAAFFQDLDVAWQAERAGSEPLAPGSFLGLLEARSERALPTFVSASPRALPPEAERALRAQMTVLEPA